LSRPIEFVSKKPTGRPLQSGGGDGTSDGMEPRVAVLETHVENIRTDVAELKSDVKTIGRDVVDLKVAVATLIERVNHLPDKGFIVRATLSGLGVIAALIMFQDHIKAFFTH